MSSATASSHRPPSSSAATSSGGGGGGKVDMFTASASRSSPQRPTSTAQQRPTPQRNQPQQQQSRNNRPSMLVSVFFLFVHGGQQLHKFFTWQVVYIGVVLHQHVLMDYNSNFDHRASTKTIMMYWKDSGEVQHRLYAPIIKLSQARHTKYS